MQEIDFTGEVEPAHLVGGIAGFEIVSVEEFVETLIPVDVVGDVHFLFVIVIDFSGETPAGGFLFHVRVRPVDFGCLGSGHAEFVKIRGNAPRVNKGGRNA